MEIPLQTERVKRGDTLEAMTRRVYGKSDDSILSLLQKSNPTIKDLNTIHVGQTIVFPPYDLTENHLTYTIQICSEESVSEARKISNRLLQKGYDVYFVPLNEDKNKGMLRIAVGNFEDLAEAQDQAEEIVREGISSETRILMVKHE
jgi:phage tail protein X